MKKLFFVNIRNRQMTFRHRFIWSLILYRNNKGRGASHNFLERDSGLNRKRTIVPLLEELASWGLVSKESDGYWCLEPQGERLTWFTWKKGVEGPWRSRLAYIVVGNRD